MIISNICTLTLRHYPLNGVDHLRFDLVQEYLYKIILPLPQERRTSVPVPEFGVANLFCHFL